MIPPWDEPFAASMLAGEILLLPSLKPGGPHLLLATNRDSPNLQGDSIALFRVDDEGTVSRTDNPFIVTGGKHLRGAGASGDGHWVLVAGRDGGGVVMFERVGEDGLNLKQVARVQLDKVVCPLWI